MGMVEVKDAGKVVADAAIVRLPEDVSEVRRHTAHDERGPNQVQLAKGQYRCGVRDRERHPKTDHSIRLITVRDGAGTCGIARLRICSLAKVAEFHDAAAGTRSP